MKNYLLVFLLCFSVLSQGMTPNAAAIAAAAQKYSNSAQAISNSIVTQLNAQVNYLNGQVSSIENIMCGVNAYHGSVDSNGNYVNSSLDSLVINTTGSGPTAAYSYASCNGGSLNSSYNSWASQIQYWSGIISNFTNSGNWTGGYDACAATGSSETAVGDNFYADLPTITSKMKTLIGSLNQVVGCVNNPNPKTPYSTDNPDLCPITMQGSFSKAISTLNSINAQISSDSGVLDVEPLLTQTNNVNNAWESYNSSKQAFIDCYNANVYNNPNACNAPQPCATELSNYIAGFQAEAQALSSFFGLVATYLPFSTTVSGISSFSASLIGCLLPSMVPDSCYITGNCALNVTTFNININDEISQFAGYVSNVNQAVANIEIEINAINIRLSAIANQVKTFSNMITTTQGQLNNIFNNCQEDITNYQSMHSNIIDTIVDTIVDVGVGLLAFSGIGAIGGTALEMLAMVLLQAPSINDNTLGEFTNILNNDLNQTIASM